MIEQAKYILETPLEEKIHNMINHLPSIFMDFPDLKEHKLAIYIDWLKKLNWMKQNGILNNGFANCSDIIDGYRKSCMILIRYVNASISESNEFYIDDPIFDEQYSISRKDNKLIVNRYVHYFNYNLLGKKIYMHDDHIYEFDSYDEIVDAIQNRTRWFV